MAFRDSGFSNGGGSTKPYTPNLVGKLVDVYMDPANVMKNKIVIEADPKDNLGVHSGTYTLTLDSTKSIADRMQYAEKAKQKGNGFCGSLINEWTLRMKGRKLMVEGINLTAENEGTGSWISSYRHERLRRPAIIHTAEERTPQGQNNGVQTNIKVYAITVYQANGFDLDDQERFGLLKSRADSLYDRATIPLHTQTAEGKTILRNSMPIAEMAFAIQDRDSGEIIEYSGFFATKEPSNSEYPEHYTADERQGFRGQPKRLPRTGEDFAKLADKFKEFAKQTYPDRNIRTIGFEGKRLTATKKGQDNPFMYGEKKKAGNKRITPLQQMHQANKTKFRMSVAKADEFTRGQLHPDVSIQFSPSQQDTYNRYINSQYEYLPQEYQDKPWIAFMKIDGKPVSLAQELIGPVENTLQHGQLNQGHSTGQQLQNTQSPIVENNHSTPQQPYAQNTRTPLPVDPAFDQSDALDHEAEEHNARMQDYEDEHLATETINANYPNDASTQQKKARPAPAPLPDTDPDKELRFDPLADNPFGANAPGA